MPPPGELAFHILTGRDLCETDGLGETGFAPNVSGKLADSDRLHDRLVWSYPERKQSPNLFDRARSDHLLEPIFSILIEAVAFGNEQPPFDLGIAKRSRRLRLSMPEAHGLASSFDDLERTDDPLAIGGLESLGSFRIAGAER